jgi:type IV pilus assembly protein PilB
MPEKSGPPATSTNLPHRDNNPDLIKLIPASLAHKYQVFPLSLRGNTLVMATADPSNIFAIDDIKFLTGYRIEAYPTQEAVIRQFLNEHYHMPDCQEDAASCPGDDNTTLTEESKQIEAGQFKSSCEEKPVITLVNEILGNAIKKGASDIHVEPYEKVVRVRFRIDGVLCDALAFPLKLKNAITSRIKIMSKLDIAERRLPQDGRVQVKLETGQEVDFRVSVLPTLFGEKIVLRLLDKSSLRLDLTKLGFETGDLNRIQQGVKYPCGMVLVTGPTGSGKTTTLYSALNALNETAKNISTVEDPVEYNLMGINQVQIHEEIGLTFANVLRALLRQDPDIILVGEIRDYETAEIAIKAALTGHLVLSTLHTNDAPSAVQRLVQMGIQQYLLSSAIILIVAQRLVRKICPHCKTATTLPEHLSRELGLNLKDCPTQFFYKGTGCSICSYSGFKGRLAIYEIMKLDDHIKQCILQDMSSADLKKEAVKSGMSTLRTSAITKMKQGLTTAEEVIRITCDS